MFPDQLNLASKIEVLLEIFYNSKQLNSIGASHSPIISYLNCSMNLDVRRDSNKASSDLIIESTQRCRNHLTQPLPKTQISDNRKNDFRLLQTLLHYQAVFDAKNSIFTLVT